MNDKQYERGDALRFTRITEEPNPRRSFVIMPLRKEFDEVYQDIIKPAVVEVGILPVRADEIYSRNAIIDDIWLYIQKSAWVIADLTGRNPNVFYELGLAHAIGRNPILLTQNIDDVPFDLRHWRCIEYQQTIRGGKYLAEALKKTIQEDRHFIRVPMDALIDKFSGGVHIERGHCKVSFEGHRGSKSCFSESWRVRIEAEAADLMYRKLRSDGVVEELHSKGATVEKKKFMEGIYFLTIVFGRFLRKDDTHDYDLTYRIHDGFQQPVEFWNFDVEANTDEILHEFDFSATQGVDYFRAFLKPGTGKEEVAMRVDENQGQFSVRATGLAIGQSILFRWKWTDNNQNRM